MSKKSPSPDAKLIDNKSPKGDSILQDPKGKPGKPTTTDKSGKNEKFGKSEPEKVERGGKSIKSSQLKPSENASTFLTDKITGFDNVPRSENVLVSSGLLDAYDYLQRQICKYGLPKGNAFEFAAITFLKYERKLKAKEADKRVEVINKIPEVRHEKEERHGRSPRHQEDTGKNASTIKSPDQKGKGVREEEVKGKGKNQQSPPPKEEPSKGGKDKGKGPQSPNPKEEERGRDKGKGGKEEKKEDKSRSKSPSAKESAKGKEDSVITDKKKGAEKDDPKAKKK